MLLLLCQADFATIGNICCSIQPVRLIALTSTDIEQWWLMRQGRWFTYFWWITSNSIPVMMIPDMFHLWHGVIGALIKCLGENLPVFLKHCITTFWISSLALLRRTLPCLWEDLLPVCWPWPSKKPSSCTENHMPCEVRPMVPHSMVDVYVWLYFQPWGSGLIFLWKYASAFCCFQPPRSPWNNKLTCTCGTFWPELKYVSSANVDKLWISQTPKLCHVLDYCGFHEDLSCIPQRLFQYNNACLFRSDKQPSQAI